MKSIELNIDLGELPGEAEELFSLAHRVNIACGGHAGDDETMRAACELAHKWSAKVGAHASYPDRPGFGRVSMHMEPDALRVSVAEQCARLGSVAAAAGVAVVHFKPHGALYHDANGSEVLARAVIGAVTSTLGRPAVVGPPEGALRKCATETGLDFLAEGFADRGYGPDGRLIARGQPGSLIEDASAAVEQCRRLMRSGSFDTLCVHSDSPNALEISRAVRSILDAAAAGQGHAH